MSQYDYFMPGENLETLGLGKEREPVQNEIEVQFPGRIHTVVFDCNRFSIGSPGGGGIGFAVKLPNRLRVEISNEDSINGPADTIPLQKHIVALMRSLLDRSLHVKTALSLVPLVSQHMGFGSTTAVMTSLMESINRMHDSPLSSDQIRSLVAANFAETYGDMLCRGLETGVGTYVILNGGMVIMSDKIKVAFSCKFLPDYEVFLIDPDTKRPDHEGSEDLSLLKRSFEEDYLFRYQKTYMTLMDFIPAVYDNDVKKMGDIIWRFQLGGDNLPLLQNYECQGADLYFKMAKLRDNDIPIVGFSSVGPTVYAITKNPNAVINVCKEFGMKFFQTTIDNDGIATIK